MTTLNPFPPVDEAAWLARVRGVLKQAPFGTLQSATDDGIMIEPLMAMSADQGPLTRPAQPWIISARVDHPNPEASAMQALDDLQGGADGLCLVFADARTAGSNGLRSGDRNALDRALAGVELDLIHMRLDAPVGPTSPILHVADLVTARRLDPSALRLEFGCDPIGTLAVTGLLNEAWSITASTFAAHVTALAERGFRGPFFVADGRPWHAAGATEVQELAALIATAIGYVRLLEAAGWPLDRALAAISFVVPVEADVLVATAKLRAVRRLWMMVSGAAGGAPQPPVIHAETSWRMLARRDPAMNILRNGLAAFAAVTAGVRSLHVLAHTTALELPDAQARRHARGIQLLLRDEMQAWRLVDPAAGSGTLEALTRSLAEAAWPRMQAFEAGNAALPGIVAALLDGSFAAELAAAAAARHARIASGERPLVGVTHYRSGSEGPPLPLPGFPQRPAPSSGAQRHILTAGEGKAAPNEGAGADFRPMAGGLPLPNIRLAAPFEEAADAPIA